jgi:Type I phosphodiesterase / nucleotide pyrophosphatase
VPIRWAYLKRVLAGAIFGLYMAHLLYFLNPQVDVTPARLLAVTLVYGAICGVLFGTALWLLRIARVRLLGRPAEGEYRTHGFGFVVFAAFIAAAIYWIHLRQLQIYLPKAAVRVLLAATNLITGTAFALLILWFFERNADRRTSRVIFGIGVLLIAISSFFLYQGRESYRTEKRNIVVANVGTVAGRRPLIVIAIRNLPYDWVLTMSGEGNLPFFANAAKKSYFTRVEPFPTTSPNALWASLATGKLPYRHGVTGQFSYRTLLSGSDPSERFLMLPSGVGFEAWGLIPPVKRISAQLPAGDALPLWTAFERLSLRSAVINWPSAARSLRPDTRGAQADVSGVAQRFNGTGAARQRIMDGLAADFGAINLARAERGFDLRIVALEGFSTAQKALHIFTNDLPPRTSMKGEALRAYAQQLDRMIETIVRENPDHLVVVVSPSAVVPTEVPATMWSLLAQEIRNDDPGADDGFVLITGPGVAHSPNPPGAEVIDVVPTILFAADLPVGRDMDGHILTQAFNDEFLRKTKLSAIQTYEADKLVVRRTGT